MSSNLFLRPGYAYNADMKLSHFLRYREQAAKNRALILKLRATGTTMQAIADKDGVSRQRVHQILKAEGRL